MRHKRTRDRAALNIYMNARRSPLERSMRPDSRSWRREQVGKGLRTPLEDNREVGRYRIYSTCLMWMKSAVVTFCI